MKVALIGASGFIGSKLLDEAVARGHQLTALVSRPERVASHAQVRALGVDVNDSNALAALLKGHDVVISAFSGHAQDNTFDYFVQGFKSILAAVKRAEVPRLLAVGGAGSLEVAPGVQALDTPGFPAEYKATAEGARQALYLLRDEPSLNWTMLSPAALIAPGERTGVFRLGADHMVADAEGQSRISVQDYAVAMIDELERPAHPRSRFTLGY